MCPGFYRLSRTRARAHTQIMIFEGFFFFDSVVGFFSLFLWLRIRFDVFGCLFLVAAAIVVVYDSCRVSQISCSFISRRLKRAQFVRWFFFFFFFFWSLFFIISFLPPFFDALFFFCRSFCWLNLQSDWKYKT